MNYKLELREIVEADIKPDCSFMPEKDKYSMYVQAFIEDINNLPIVQNAFEESNAVIIELNVGVNIEELASACIPIHKYYWEQFRTKGFVKIT